MRALRSAIITEIARREGISRSAAGKRQTLIKERSQWLDGRQLYTVSVGRINGRFEALYEFDLYEAAEDW